MNEGLLPKGTVITYGGLPFELAKNTLILGNAANFLVMGIADLGEHVLSAPQKKEHAS